ncbi:hypothetical protein M2360_000907 [Rhizobium sp. SG_E_25_P2]|uniref:hypothetical protein n=1 Tax=Rhizobium sp. SG_E_25_P2 TaxID=2879942 RepID=UPI002476CE1E|nr:hypothetical protein [Rhizobium sp. SG_E_25_P2]MDH6265517.1 hypothetical protein [Rhizobium sp. SG_E_25_P2]
MDRRFDMGDFREVATTGQFGQWLEGKDVLDGWRRIGAFRDARGVYLVSVEPLMLHGRPVRFADDARSGEAST